VLTSNKQQHERDVHTLRKMEGWHASGEGRWHGGRGSWCRADGNGEEAAVAEKRCGVDQDQQQIHWRLRKRTEAHVMFVYCRADGNGEEAAVAEKRCGVDQDQQQIRWRLRKRRNRRGVDQDQQQMR